MGTEVESSIETQPHFANPKIDQLGLPKQHVLAHEIGAGSACRDCDCEGLDLHFWRKICKACGCRMDAHDVQLPNEYDHGQIVINRLFGIKERFEPIAKQIESIHLRHHSREGSSRGSRTTSTSSPVPESLKSVDDDFDTHRSASVQKVSTINNTAAYNYAVETKNDDGSQTYVVRYSWVPLRNTQLLEKYMKALPEEERPIAGTVGEQNRKSRLQYQVPLYDLNVDDARFVAEEDKPTLANFVGNVRKNVIGIGNVVEIQDPSINPAGTPSKASELLKELRDGDSQTDSANNSGTSHEEQICTGPVDCKHCATTINVGDVGVKTDHGTKGDAWHPNCFRCSQCDQLLVDMIYFFHQGKYYCGRHFSDLQYPRCAGCDELIFAREYTFAEEKAWHFEHFACFKCDLKLGGHRYMTKDEQPHCIECYMKYFAKTCDSCCQKIGPDEQRLNYQDVHWHAKEECFQCKQCHQNLIGKKFLLKDHNLFCSSQCRTDFANTK